MTKAIKKTIIFMFDPKICSPSEIK